MKLKSRILYGCLLAVGITMGAVACTAGDEGPKESQKTPEQSMSSTVNSIRDLSLKYADMDEEEMKAAEDHLTTFFDPAMDAEKRNDVVGVFAQVIEMDPNATIEVDPDKILTEGDTAKINGKDIRVTMNDKVQETGDESGVITLKLQDNKWVISDIEIPGSESTTLEDPEALEGATNE